jgi:hypothetical protein
LRQEILDLLSRFRSLDRATIVDLVLKATGRYSLIREQELDRDLEQLRLEGCAVSHFGRFGRWILAPDAKNAIGSPQAKEAKPAEMGTGRKKSKVSPRAA